MYCMLNVFIKVFHPLMFHSIFCGNVGFVTFLLIAGRSQYLWQCWRNVPVKASTKCPPNEPVPRDASTSASSVPVTSGRPPLTSSFLSVGSFQQSNERKPSLFTHQTIEADVIARFFCTLDWRCSLDQSMFCFMLHCSAILIQFPLSYSRAAIITVPPLSNLPLSSSVPPHLASIASTSQV